MNDLPERPVIRAEGRALLKLAIWVAVFLAIEAIAIVWLRPAQAEGWSKPDIPCKPFLGDIARAAGTEGLVLAGAWWCDLPDGVHMRYVTGTVKAPTEIATLLASLTVGDDWSPLISAYWGHESTASEQELVTRIQLQHQPHCYVTGTGATAAILTSTAQGFIGPAKTDAAAVGMRVAVGAPLPCWDRLERETAKRYCRADTLTDTKGRRVEGDAWVACKLERAPAQGWQ